MNSEFPVGARVLVDGRFEAIVKASHPVGSESYMFPHYRLDFIDGKKDVVVAVRRVGVEQKG